MTDRNVKFGYYLATLVFFLLFGFFIWPTLYYYVPAPTRFFEYEEPSLVRINRVTGRAEYFFTGSPNVGIWIKFVTPKERRRAVVAQFRQSVKQPVDTGKFGHIGGMMEYFRMPRWQEAALRVARDAGYGSLVEITKLPDEAINLFIDDVDKAMTVAQRKAKAIEEFESLIPKEELLNPPGTKK